MKSIWSENVSLPERPPLDGELSVDVAVIGGGLAGVLTAYLLREQGVEAVVLEARRVGSGQTRNTTAKVTLQHGLIYGRLIEQFGHRKAEQYARANRRAIEEYRQMIKRLHINCDWEECPAYLYSTLDAAPLRQEAEAARSLGIEAELTGKIELPFSVEGALMFPDQARFHPLKFLATVAAQVPVYENTRVKKAEQHCLLTDRGKVTAKRIVFATHYPFVNRPGYYFLRMHQERSYVLALENAAILQGMYYGVDPDGFSFRPAGDVLLLGGGNHRTGENSKGGRYDRLRRKAKELWPRSQERTYWSAQDCMTLDGIPYIGPFTSENDNWHVATGFQKWGMTTSMAAAQILTCQITGQSHPDEDVFSPQRFALSASAKTLAEEGLQAAKGIARSFLGLPRASLDALPLGHGGIVEQGGEKVGVYKNEQGETFAVSTRCPHLGCQLEWNPDEKSWDCPCHGSRFDYRGQLIDNPAQEDLPHA